MSHQIIELRPKEQKAVELTIVRKEQGSLEQEIAHGIVKKIGQQISEQEVKKITHAILEMLKDASKQGLKPPLKASLEYKGYPRITVQILEEAPVKKFKKSEGINKDMGSLYEKLKKEDKFFEQGAPTNFTVSFYTKREGAKGLDIALKYGSIVSKPSVRPGIGCSLIISRTQLLALRDSKVKFFPMYGKCFTKQTK